MYDGVEDLLVEMTHNIQKGMPDENYIRLLSLLRMWTYRFKKGVGLINAMDEAQNHYNNISSSGKQAVSVPVTTGFIDNSPHIDALNLDLAPTYKYDESVQVYAFTKPEKTANQTLTDYYAKWFSSKTVPPQKEGQTLDQYYEQWTGP